MESSGFSIGILFNALVSGIVAGAAFVLVVFMFRRYRGLTMAMQAYAWFWFFTVLVWIPISIRYIFIGVGSGSAMIEYLDIALQTAVFLGGLPLTYYVSMRVFRSEWLAGVLALASMIPALLAIKIMIQPGGLIPQDITFFTAETVLNAKSLSIFNAEASVILILLVFDTIMTLRQWIKSRSKPIFYEAFYSLAVVLYLITGSIEQSGIITDWILVIFRIIYTGIFLVIYLLITQHEASEETYLVEEFHTAA